MLCPTWILMMILRTVARLLHRTWSLELELMKKKLDEMLNWTMKNFVKLQKRMEMRWMMKMMEKSILDCQA